MNITPLFDNVLIQPVEAPVQNCEWYYFTRQCKRKPQIGTVKAIGKGKTDKDGKLIPMVIKVGDKVMYKKWGGNEVKIDGEEWTLVRKKIFLQLSRKSSTIHKTKLCQNKLNTDHMHNKLLFQESINSHQAVVTTLGPKGRNVALDKKWGGPSVIHDGVTVAKEIELADPFENMGAQMVKEAASKQMMLQETEQLQRHFSHNLLFTTDSKNVTAGAIQWF